MPTYRFENTKTGEIYEELMSIAEMEEHKKQKHINLLIKYIFLMLNIEQKTILLAWICVENF